MDTKKTDDQLASDLSAGTELALRLLIQRHGASVFGICMRMFGGNKAMAEELAQDVWLNVVRKIDTYDQRGHFRAWVNTIARNQCISSLRKKKEYLSDEPENLEVADEFDLEADLIQGQENLKVRRAIDGLPANQRVPLMLWLGEDLKLEEISERLSISLASVKTQLFRARQTLKARLGEK